MKILTMIVLPDMLEVEVVEGEWFESSWRAG